MGKRFFYYCEDQDNCQFAEDGRRIWESEVSPSIDGGNPKCPGRKKEGGSTCGETLVGPFEEGGIDPKWIALAVAALVVVALLTVFLPRLFGPAGSPVIRVEPVTLVLRRSDSGLATADLVVRNEGEVELVVERVEVRPAAFVASTDSLQVPPADSGTLVVRFQSDSQEMTEGQLVLHSNALDSPTTVELVANRNPWWVYERLGSSSTLYKAEQ